MAELTFYGGVNEIGGTKILLEDGEKRLLLDFGFPFKGNKQFYEEYLRPRGGAGLLDPLEMGLLPPLEGLYRDDLETPELWQRFRNHPLYRKIYKADALLLSHAHADHTGYISFLKDDIPIYSTAVTAFITKANQDSGKAGFDQQVCYYSPVSYDCPKGLQQKACLSNSRQKIQRRFCIEESQQQNLSPEATRFWQEGFWERTPRQPELISSLPGSHNDCCLNIKCFPVDHSIPGACAWGIETSAGWVVYSGDLRLHGKRPDLTQQFIEQAAALKPVALILEGTNLHGEDSFSHNNVSEKTVYENALKAVSSSDKLVIADFSPRDVDRLLTFLQIARDTNRKLAILPKDVYLLKTVGLLDERIPDIAAEGSIVIYQKTAARADNWQQRIYDDYSDKVVLAADINAAQDEYILCFSFFDINELPSLRPSPDSLYVFSSSEPHDEEQEIDFRRLHQWLKHFGFKGYGLPLEKDGKWQTTEAEKGLHASGHACGKDLLEIARNIKPQLLIPVHSERPDLYQNAIKNNGMDIILPVIGNTVHI